MCDGGREPKGRTTERRRVSHFLPSHTLPLPFLFCLLLLLISSSGVIWGGGVGRRMMVGGGGRGGTGLTNKINELALVEGNLPSSLVIVLLYSLMHPRQAGGARRVST